MVKRKKICLYVLRKMDLRRKLENAYSNLSGKNLTLDEIEERLRILEDNYRSEHFLPYDEVEKIYPSIISRHEKN